MTYSLDKRANWHLILWSSLSICLLFSSDYFWFFRLGIRPVCIHCHLEPVSEARTRAHCPVHRTSIVSRPPAWFNRTQDWALTRPIWVPTPPSSPPDPNRNYLISITGMATFTGRLVLEKGGVYATGVVISTHVTLSGIFSGGGRNKPVVVATDGQWPRCR